MDFEKTYSGARVLLMEENYRSTPEILQSADRFIQKNQSRHPKTIHPTRASGANVHLISDVDRAVPGLAGKVAEQGKTSRHSLPEQRQRPAADRPAGPGRDTLPVPPDGRHVFTHRIVTDILDILALAHDPGTRRFFLRIYYTSRRRHFPESGGFACQKSRATGMLHPGGCWSFPQLSQYAQGHAPILWGPCRKLLQDTALCGLNRIWKGPALHGLCGARCSWTPINMKFSACWPAGDRSGRSGGQLLDRLRALVSRSGTVRRCYSLHGPFQQGPGI